MAADLSETKFSNRNRNKNNKMMTLQVSGYYNHNYPEITKNFKGNYMWLKYADRRNNLLTFRITR